MPIRRIALLAFPRLTLLDLVGPYDSLRRLAPLGIDPDVAITVIGTAEEIPDEGGVRLRTHAVYPDLADFDLLVVPGGLGTRALMRDERLLAYLRTWGHERPLASVCTGSLLLGAAGYLAGKRATTHHLAFDELRPLCGEVVAARIVDEGLVVTAGGVASGLDLGLFLVERFWGAPARERVAAQMEYQPQGDARSASGPAAVLIRDRSV